MRKKSGASARIGVTCHAAAEAAELRTTRIQPPGHAKNEPSTCRPPHELSYACTDAAIRWAGWNFSGGPFDARAATKIDPRT
jgi:hypothetical protein